MVSLFHPYLHPYFIHADFPKGLKLINLFLGCIEKTCCDRVHVDGLTFIRQNDRQMNGRPFYELEGGGEDVYLYYYHDGKKNRYWLISKYVRIETNFLSFKIVQNVQNYTIHSTISIHCFTSFYILLTVYFY